MNKESDNNEFSFKLTEYISKAVESLKDEENGHHRMTVNNFHLLDSSNVAKKVSRLALNPSDCTKDIVNDFLDNQPLN